MKQAATSEDLVIHLTTEEFKAQAIDDPSPLLIDFWAPWCGPCRTMAPFLAEAAQQLKDEVRVGKINVDEERKLAEIFGIASIPTLVLMQGGKVAGAVSGVMPAAGLIQWVKAQLAAKGDK